MRRAAVGTLRTMRARHESWKVLPHEPIEKLEDNLWRVEGQLENMPLKRVMTLARLPDGRLVIHSAIALGEAAMAEVEAWGEPAFLVVPNGYHRLDVSAFKRRYPKLQVVCPRAARSRVAEVAPVDLDLGELPPLPDVKLRHLEGCGDAEGVMVVRSGEGATLVLNDVVFNMPHLPGLKGLVFRYVTASSGGPRVSRVARMFIVKDRNALRADLERLAATPDLRRIIVSHHQIIDHDPGGTLRRVADQL